MHWPLGLTGILILALNLVFIGWCGYKLVKVFGEMLEAIKLEYHMTAIMCAILVLMLAVMVSPAFCALSILYKTVSILFQLRSWLIFK